MYLPATFHYGYEAAAYPQKFDIQHGSGFVLDTVNNKIVTKFTSGVALLQVPFYLVGAFIAETFSIDEQPYSRFYLIFMDIGLAFYCTMGLFFFKKWIEYYTSSRTGFIAMLVIFFSTHLYYYTLDENLMSHAYSFALMSGSLYAMKSWMNTNKQKYFVMFVSMVAVATLIRPTNILFGLIGFFLDVKSWQEGIAKFKSIFMFRNVVISALVFLLIFLPQLMYWKFAYGNFIVWSYSNEGFENWNDPWFLSVWFSPQSGLFPYTPILIVALVLAVYGMYRKKSNAFLVLITFMLVSYMCAAWINPFFGSCNFGKRPFVEYLPILMLPIAWAIHGISRRSKRLQWGFYSMLLLFAYYNIGLFGAFDTCFIGTTWDWSAFNQLLYKGCLSF